jgi:putative transposase
MPEHVHLLLSEPERRTLAQAIQALKVSVAKKISQQREPFWQKRYYDHNVRNYESFVGKLRYIHRNPVARGLVERPEDWPWSSFRHYALREMGVVEIESEWTARLREKATCNPP